MVIVPAVGNRKKIFTEKQKLRMELLFFFLAVNPVRKKK